MTGICARCIYKNACGEDKRKEPCNGRRTSRDVKKDLDSQCSFLCQYRDACLIAKGIYTDSWGEGIPCKMQEDNYQKFMNGEDVLPF